MIKSKFLSTLHKPRLLGLCFYFFFTLSFFVLSAFSFTGCKEPEIVLPGVSDSTKTDSTKTDSSTIVVLKPTDIVDYDKFYKPQEFKNMDLLRSDSKWSFVRSKQSEHFIVLWEAGFGANPNGSTVPAEFKVDIDDLLKKAESFFDLNVNRLKFADLKSSNLSKYKMQIYLLYQTEWAAFGGGVDDVIGGLWINPATCKPVSSVIAHEIGHSFQYQVYADLLASGACPNDFSRGFRYGFGGNGGNGYWEQTAQWQAYQSYPMEAFQSYNFGVYTDNYHRHICHEFQRYASYFINDYWADKHGIDFVGKLWRESKSPEDPIQAYMRLNSLSVDQLNADLYEAATKMVTWDFDAIRANGHDYIGKFSYRFYQLTDGTYQVAYARCPGSTGYNVIPLNVPAAGTVISTSFAALSPGSALAPGDPGQYSDNDKTFTTTKYNASLTTRAGWRYGYVALLSNGERIYGEMNRKTASDIQFIVPQGCERLWLVVLGAPSTYLPCAWDEKESNDDQWPYTVKFANTDLLGSIVINPNDTPKDLTLTYNVSFPADATGYTGTTVNLTQNGDIVKVAQALVLQPSAIKSALLGAKASPAEGKIAFAAKESTDLLNYETTANGYGFWFDSAGNAIGWGKDNGSKVFTELSTTNFEFTIGQYPGKSKAGDKCTVKNAFVYTKNAKQYLVTFVFNITVK